MGHPRLRLAEHFGLLVDENGHALGEAYEGGAGGVGVGEEVEAAGVLAEPVEGLALEVEGFELGLDEADGGRLGGVPEDEILDLVVDDPPAVPGERRLQCRVLGARPDGEGAGTGGGGEGGGKGEVCEDGFHRHVGRRRRSPSGGSARGKTIDLNGPPNGSGTGRY